MYLKTFLIYIIYFASLATTDTISATNTDVVIDMTNVEGISDIYLSDGEKNYKVPESGVAKIDPEYLPALIEISSLKGSKFKTHTTIWLTGDAIAVEGSIDEGTIRLSPASNGKIIERDLKKEWKRFRKGKDKLPQQWEPLLVYVVNHLQFIETGELNKLIEQLPEEGREFWAGREIMKFLREFERVGYDASKEKFHHLTALNKNKKSERYERPGDKYLLIDFAASWCKPCLEELDDLAKLQRKHTGSLELLSIWNDSDHSEWLNTAKKQKSYITWKSMRDETGAIFEAFGINIYPTYLLINPDGEVEKRVEGAYLKKIKKYLKRL